MKGLVFVELIKMAETMLGEATVDDVLSKLDIPSGGSYTSVGYYSCDELIKLVNAFSEISDIARPELERVFGHWVMDAFKKGYPAQFENHQTAFEMLASIENQIHVEVRKLYPDAELPSLTTTTESDKLMKIEYQSSRPLAHFCLGLVERCIDLYGETASVELIKYQAHDAKKATISVLREQ